MSAQTRSTGSRFVVDLGSLKLSNVDEKRVESEIQAVVLRVLAENDQGGRSRLANVIIDQVPDGTLGLIFNPVDGDGGGWSPWTPSLGSSTKPLTVEDHTMIVRAIMEHPFEVIQYLDKSERTRQPSPMAVLEAALKVEQIDSYTKDRIRAVMDILPLLEDAHRNAPAELKRNLEQLRGRLSRPSIDEQIRTLRSTRSTFRNSDGLAEGMEVAAQILEDGRSTIYSPDFPFNRMLRAGDQTRASRKPIDDIKNADTLGAVGGGGVGVFVGGVGAGPGAAAGGAGASAGAAIAHAILWLFD
jgi:hypothetical protein